MTFLDIIGAVSSQARALGRRAAEANSIALEQFGLVMAKPRGFLSLEWMEDGRKIHKKYY